MVVATLTDKVDLVLGLFAGFVIGFLIGVYLTRAGVLAATTPTTAASKQYGVQYQYDEKGNIKQVLPVSVPG
jgi:hypothetical protein